MGWWLAGSTCLAGHHLWLSFHSVGIWSVARHIQYCPAVSGFMNDLAQLAVCVLVIFRLMMQYQELPTQNLSFHNVARVRVHAWRDVMIMRRTSAHLAWTADRDSAGRPGQHDCCGHREVTRLSHLFPAYSELEHVRLEGIAGGLWPAATNNMLLSIRRAEAPIQIGRPPSAADMTR